MKKVYLLLLTVILLALPMDSEAKMISSEGVKVTEALTDAAGGNTAVTPEQAIKTGVHPDSIPWAVLALDAIDVKADSNSSQGGLGRLEIGVSYPLVSWGRDWVEIDLRGQRGWISRDSELTRIQVDQGRLQEVYQEGKDSIRFTFFVMAVYIIAVLIFLVFLKYAGRYLDSLRAS